MDSISASAARYARQWTEFRLDLSGISQTVRRATEAIAEFDRISHRNLASPDLLAQLAKFSTVRYVPALHAAAVAAQLADFDTTFLGSIHRRLEELQRAGVTIEPAMAEANAAIAEQAAKLPQSWVNLNGMLGLVIQILVVLIQLWHAEVSDNRRSSEMRKFIESQLRATEARCAVLIQTLRPPHARVPVRVIERQCYIRTDRYPRSPIIGVLYPNQLVEVHRTSGKWASVEFFDYVDAIPKTGWILKKYARLIDPMAENIDPLPGDQAE